MSDVKFTKNVGNKQATAWRVDRIVTREQENERLPGFGGMLISGTKVTREVHESRIDEHGELQHRVRRTESMSGAIHHEANGRAVLVPKRNAYMIPSVAVRRPVLPSWRPTVRASGRAPRSASHVTRSASSASSGDSSDGGSDSQDSSDGPDLPASLPLIGGNLRNEFHNDNSHKQEHNINIDLIDRLTLGCAGLLFCALASLAVRWSR